MSNPIGLRFLILLIAAPGLGILGRSGFTLMAWVYNRPSSRPHITDDFLLALVSADTTLASLPLLISFVVGLYARVATVSISAFAITGSIVIAYSLLYFFFARNRLATLRLAIRKRSAKQLGA